MRLVITEKPSVAQAISAVIGAKERKEGCFTGNGYIVSWCVGHLVELAHAEAYDERFAKWRREDLPILPQNWKFTASSGKKKQLDILKRLISEKTVESVICATDAGREGQLIFQLVYDYCKCKKPVQRLWISSMEDSAIRDGFAKLRPGADYERLYQAALCRSQADWLVGINATRLFSCLYGATLNVGRVQTPTLALLVSREADIGAFVKEPFYTPELDCATFIVSGERVKDKTAAETIRSTCDGKNAIVREVKRQEKSIAPPKLYDLTTLQREANRLFGYTAQQTLDYAQELYEKKLITYPRTDSRFLTEDMASGLPALVSSVAVKFGIVSDSTINTAQVIDNSKVSDHYALIPTTSAAKCDLAALGVGHLSILRMLAVRLICAVGERHVYAETTIIAECGGYTFSAKGKTIIKDGWKAVERAFRATLKEKPKDDDDGETSLPELAEGQTFPSITASVREGFTSPPKHFSEDTLLQSMETAGAEDMPEDAERKGLGTPATRAGTIEKLVKSGFVERKNKQLLPTDKGRNLIAVLPEAVKSPALTAEWEHRLGLVERGELTSTAFMSGIADMTRELVGAHTAPDERFKALFASPKLSGEVVGACPRCGGDVCESKKGFFCSTTDCGFALWRDNKFFAAKKKELTKAIATALLTEGRVFVSGLYSERTSKTYDAMIVMDDTGKYVNFKLDFDGRKN